MDCVDLSRVEVAGLGRGCAWGRVDSGADFLLWSGEGDAFTMAWRATRDRQKFYN